MIHSLTKTLKHILVTNSTLRRFLSLFYFKQGLAGCPILPIYWRILFLLFFPVYIPLAYFLRRFQIKFFYFFIPSSVGHVLWELDLLEISLILGNDISPHQNVVVFSGSHLSSDVSRVYQDKSLAKSYTNQYLYLLLFPLFFSNQDIIKPVSIAHFTLSSSNGSSLKSLVSLFLFPFLSRTNNDLRNFNRNFNNLYESNHQKIINHRIKRRNNLSSALSKNKPLNSLLPSQYFIIQFKQYSGNATPTPYSLQDKVKLFELVSSTLGIKGIQIGSHFESLSSQTDNTNIIDLTIGSAFPSLLSPVSFKDQLLVSSRAKCAFINASGCESIFATMEIPYVYYGSWHLLMNCISSQAINVPTLIYNKHTNTFLNLKDQLFVHNSIADTSGHDPTLLDPHLHFLIPTLDEILEAYQLVTYGSEFLQKLKYDQELFLKNYLCDSDLSHSYSMGMPMLPSKFSILTSL